MQRHQSGTRWKAPSGFGPHRLDPGGAGDPGGRVVEVRPCPLRVLGGPSEARGPNLRYPPGRRPPRL